MQHNKPALLEKANSLPMSPGVYIMRDKNAKVIYVGKSRKLKNRVSQYFQNGEKNLKTARMVQSVCDFDYYVCDSEIEALSLENTLIKQYTMTASTGSVSAKGVTCTGDITVKVSTGRLNAENVSSKSFTSTGSTGSASLKNVIAEESFSVKRSTGSIKLDGCDAASIVISTDTGNITGTLLSEKNFIASSDTGNISVPDTHTGGRCELTTDTGDIKISIKKCAEAHYRALSYRA